VITFADASFCADAELYEVADVRTFHGGRRANRHILFIPEKPWIGYSTIFGGDGGIEVMWCFRHILRIEGMEPVEIIVPWRVVPQEELERNKKVEGSKEIYQLDKSLYPYGQFTPLEGAALQAFLRRGGGGMAIGVPPYAIRVERLGSLPAGSAEKIRAHVEALAARYGQVRR
jgi:hypothetical protein